MIEKLNGLVTNGEVGLIKKPEHVARAIKGDVRGILSTEHAKLYAEMEKEDEAKKKQEEKVINKFLLSFNKFISTHSLFLS